MKITELSEQTGIPASTIRVWEKYLSLKVPRDEMGNRIYSQEWVEYFKRVKELVDQGKSFEEIKGLITPPEVSEGETENTELTTLQDELTGLQGDFTEVKEEVGGLRAEVAEVKKQSAGLREELTTLQDTLTRLQEEITGVSLEPVNTELATLQDKVTTLQTELSGVRNEIKSLQDENVTLKKLVSQKTNIWVYIFGLIGVVLALLFIIGLFAKIFTF